MKSALWVVRMYIGREGGAFPGEKRDWGRGRAGRTRESRLRSMKTMQVKKNH